MVVDRQDNRAAGRGASDAGDDFIQGEFLPKMIWSCLRGRLAIASVVAVVLGVALAVVGFVSTRPAYTSEGKVRIAPSPTTIMFQTEFNQTTPYFRDYIMTEATRLRSGPVHELALQDPAVVEAGWPQGPVGLYLLERSVEVDYPVGEVITVGVTDEDQAKAQAMMNALLRSYMRLQDEQIRGKADTIESSLGERERRLREEFDGLNAQYEQLVARHGSPDGLQHHLTSLNEESLELRSTRREYTAEIETKNEQIGERRGAIASWRGRMLGEDGAEVGPTAEQLALTDDRVAELVEDRRTIMKRVDLEKGQGLLESHPSIVKAYEEVDLIDGLIADRVGGLVDQWWVAYKAETDDMATRVASLRRQVAEIDGQVGEIEAQLAEGSRTVQEVRSVQEKTETARDRLQAVLDRREEVGFEHTTADTTRRLGQAEILQWGDLPLNPSKDSRKLRAAAGLIAGMGMGVGAVVTFGLVRRRYRFTDELVDAELGVPLIGSVPVLAGRDLSSPGRLGELAHQLRAVIELRSGNEDECVLAVTSSTPGEGKSTVAVAIAASFAAAGHKTLLVDADPHGGAVTHRFGIDLGKAGFSEAVRGDESAIAPVGSGVGNLEVLAVGGAGSGKLPAVSRASTAALMRKLRERYDRVVVDTGVLSGSAEAALCCQASDVLIGVVRRGQTRGELRTALSRMHELGLRCDGLIFNRAEARDAERYTSMPAWSAGAAPGSLRENGGEGRVASAYS